MIGKIDTFDEILAALPGVQDAVREEIAARITAGEPIAGKDHGRELRAELRSLSRSDANPLRPARRSPSSGQLRGQLRRSTGASPSR